MGVGKRIWLVLAILSLEGCTVTDYTLMAKSHHEAHRFDDAIEAGKKATEIDPGHAPAWYWLGVSYAKKQQWDEAITALEKVLRLNPSPAQRRSSYDYLGLAYSRKGRYGEAIPAFKQAIELFADDPQYQGVLYHSLGFAYAETGDFDQAIQAYRRALTLKIKDEEVTVRELRRASLMKYLQPARAAITAGNYPAAWAAYRRVLSLNRKDPGPYGEVGSLLLGLCDPGASIRVLEEGLKHIQNDWGLRRWLGLAYGQKGEPARVREYRGLAAIWAAFREEKGGVSIQTVYQDGPAAKAGLQSGDQILLAEGTPVRDVKQVFALIEKEEPGTSISLRIRRGENAFDTNVPRGSILDRHWPVKPRTCEAQALNREGVTLARGQKLVAALAKFEEAAQVGAGFLPKAHYNAALVLEQIGRPPEALTHYVAALRESILLQDEIEILSRLVALAQQARIPVPDSADRRYRVGILRAQQKRYQEAIQEFEAALAEAPWLVDGYYNLGLVYDFTENYFDALRALRIYLQLAPTAPNIGPVKSKIVEIEDRLQSAEQ